ncbi:hypothetical protein VQ045_09230 [Aurantimonas sp. E1-2-R+4]|uniref:hypothetical protein n=1 Tax=Aurantimonas sp. E1-2-R+4 TaxID=3113714 RepID=UPI002F92B0F4
MEEELANARQRISRLMTVVERGLIGAADPDLAAKLSAEATHNDGGRAVPTGSQEWCTRQGSNL